MTVKTKDSKIVNYVITWTSKLIVAKEKMQFQVSHDSKLTVVHVHMHSIMHFNILKVPSVVGMVVIGGSVVMAKWRGKSNK